MAVELGSAAVTNVIMVGFAANHPTLPLSIEALQETVTAIAPRGRELNLRALQLGFEAGKTDLSLQFKT